MAEKKEKQYVSDNAQLMTEWDWEKNSEISLYPDKLTCGSGIKVWWRCSKEHEWQATIHNRNNGTGCPYCSNQRVFVGYNDLETVNPILAKEWNYEKNAGLSPSDVTSNTNKKAWWLCSKGHTWQASVSHRNNGSGCPYCAGKKALKGYNDIQSCNFPVASEWNFEKNDSLKPENFTFGSGKKVWWKCKKGHEWQARIADRIRGKGCPICNLERSTSFPEYAILYYLQKYDVYAMHSYREFGYELDIYIPSKRIAIEYDGYFWHKNKSKEDKHKNMQCKNDGIQLYRIREGLPSLNNYSIDYTVRKDQKDLSFVLSEVFLKIFGTRLDVDVQRDAIAIESSREYTEKEHSILYTNSNVAIEWNYEKNGNLRPENLSANSGKKVWWKCKNGHEWQSTIDNRNRGHGCPYCSGRYVVAGNNDLQTINPSLSLEWSFEKNQGLTPSDIAPNSDRKVWWKCSKGHEWKTAVYNRTYGYGCPYCSGRYVIKGQNDLQTVNPALALEWNYEKNEGLTPSDIAPNSDKKAWWQCSKGHEWETTVNNRNNGRGCPYCSGKKTLMGFNDLQTINPTLSKEWNYEKNIGLTPVDVTPNSNKKVWWKCHKGHEWQTTVAHRNSGTGCPYCLGRKKQEA